MATEDWSKKTSDMPMEVRRQWRADRALRPPMRSPGRPAPSRAVQRQFWALIATGITTAEAAVRVGVSVPVGTRWFRHAGGMRPLSLDEPTRRYLTFEEREEIAILYAKEVGVREIARRLGRGPFDDLSGTAPECCHSWPDVGVSGGGGSVEDPGSRQAPEGG